MLFYVRSLVLLGTGLLLAGCMTTGTKTTVLPDGSTVAFAGGSMEGLTVSTGMLVAYRCGGQTVYLRHQVMARDPMEAKSVVPTGETRTVAKRVYGCSQIAAAGGATPGLTPILGAAVSAAGAIAGAPKIGIINQNSAAASAVSRNVNINRNRQIQNNNQQVNN